jgi:hypothetical protein
MYVFDKSNNQVPGPHLKYKYLCYNQRDSSYF